jgi:hypothetical protein
MSILSKLTDAVKSLTSDKANTDVPAGVEVPEPDDGAVPRPDREPQVGFEPEGKSQS